MNQSRVSSSKRVIAGAGDVTIRRATADDAPALHRQWADARWVTLDQPVPQREIPLFPTWVAEIDGAVVGGAMVVPFEQRVGGTAFSMAGIRGVTCAIHQRRRGVIDRLFRQLLHEVRGDYEVSALWPFSPPFYERYDYGMCGHDVRWRLLLEDLTAPEPEVNPRPLERTDLPAIERLVDRELVRIGNGAIRPDAYWLERRFFPRDEKSIDPTGLGWFDDGGELKALVSFEARDGGGGHKNRARVHDWLGVDRDWRDRALGFMRCLRDQYVELEVVALHGDGFHHYSAKPYRYEETVSRGAGDAYPAMLYEPNWQARFLDPSRALAQPRALHGDGGVIAVHLTDTVFDDLNGTFVWTIDAAAPGWEPAAGSTGGLPELHTSMGDLSRLWYGGFGVHALLRMERIRCDEGAAAILHRALGGFRCHMQIGF